MRGKGSRFHRGWGCFCRLSTDEDEGTGFSTQGCPHLHKTPWKCGQNGRLFVAGVDVGVDVLDDLGNLRVGFGQLLDSVNGVHDGGVVAAFELLADLLEGEVGHAADLVHGDLPGQGGVLGAALPPEGVGVNVVKFAHLVDDDVLRGEEVGLVLEHVPHRPGDGVHVHALPHQLLEGEDFVDRALDLPYVGGDVLRGSAVLADNREAGILSKLDAIQQELKDLKTKEQTPPQKAEKTPQPTEKNNYLKTLFGAL